MAQYMISCSKLSEVATRTFVALADLIGGFSMQASAVSASAV